MRSFLAIATTAGLCLFNLLSCGHDTRMQRGDQAPSQTISESSTQLAKVDPRPSRPLVQTASGSLLGARQGDVDEFLAIPFAKPPVGNLRFQKPVAFGEWSGVRDVGQRPNICLQQSDGQVVGSEDCLYLNVWSPRIAANADGVKTHVPVMIFIHGGAFDNGSGIGPTPSSDLYRGNDLAKLGQVVVVTINYRLGILGFLNHPALRKVMGHSGNLGILDQIEAMKWVRGNIAAFGGDPNNVTIFGESAGAMSVCTHVAQKYQPGLFHRAIMQSGNCQAVPKSDAEAFAVELSSRMNCSKSTAEETAACLTSVPVATIMAVQPNFKVENYQKDVGFRLPFAPTIDGTLYDQAPLTIIASGKHQKVPMIIGSNRYEVPGILYFDVKTEQQAIDLLASMTNISSAEATKVINAYPTEMKPRDKMGAIATDVQFTCVGRKMTEILGSHKQTVFNYRFDLLMAFHGVELPYVFQKLRKSAPNMETMGRMWTSFARKADPMNSWKPYNEVTGTTHLVIDQTLSAVDEFRKAECAALEGAGIAIP
jgi:para-nitrobenzyl esterase